MIVTVLTNHPRSGSGAALAEALRERGVRASTATPASRRVTRGRRVVINYATTQSPVNFRQGSVTWSNTTNVVNLCSDKRATFEMLDGAVPRPVPVLERSLVLDNRVRNWLTTDGKVVVRRVVNGHSGAGLEIVRTGHEIPRAPLYTRYFKKDAEYRVHVAFGRVILIQQKRRESDREQTDIEKLVRTRANHWVFTINDLSCDQRGYRDALCDIALRAASAVGANHCGVDILVKHGNANDLRVVEINSGCALRADSTLNAYADAFAEWIRGLR